MPFDTSALDAALTALKAYDWGADAAAFKSLDEAVIAAHGEAALRADLEKRLSSVLAAGPWTTSSAPDAAAAAAA